MRRGRREGGEENRRCLDYMEWGTDGGERGATWMETTGTGIVEPN